MNCLCCGKPLKAFSETGWHKSCIKRFFGTSTLPEIDISSARLEMIVSETVQKGLTVPGVQKKLSLHLFSEGKQPRLTLVGFPTGFILKPQVEEFPCMPESEHLVMTMAEACGIATVPHALIRDGDNIAYITKRIDRRIEKDHLIRLAMEDFCQLDLRLTRDKYRGSYERCSKIIDRYSSRRQLDQTELFLRLVFCFLTGNSDMHLKNFSLISKEAGNYVLSQAYDLINVHLVFPEDTEELALTLDGRKKKIGRMNFVRAMESSGLESKVIENIIKKFMNAAPKWYDFIDISFLSQELKEKYKAEIAGNLAKL